MGAVGPVNGAVGPWIIVISAFMCHLIVDGTCSTFSLHSADISNLEGGAMAKKVIAWAGSLLSGVYMIFGKNLYL